ncbi:hypothetical protein ACFYOF_18545 [Streptomyces sp. NPDC007148]|uniref:hypothetical protein n=1 Tax=unclassified Streptomyces TaxID=2593676 RepID=UPI00341D9030
MATNEQERSAAHLAERLIGLEGPKEVFLAAGEWMAYRLESDGFRWLNGRTSLERRLDGRLERMRLEGSRWNRAGKLIEFSIASLEVFDDELQAWRRLNADRTVERPGSMEGIVCATSFLDISREAKAIITLPVSRLAAVDRLYEHAREVALPWFRSSEDPEGLAAAVPDALLRPTGFAQDLLELLVSRGLSEEARSLIQRVLALGESHRDSFTEGRDLAINGERPLWHSPQSLGWSSEVLGLI